MSDEGLLAARPRDLGVGWIGDRASIARSGGACIPSQGGRFFRANFVSGKASDNGTRKRWTVRASLPQ